MPCNSRCACAVLSQGSNPAAIQPHLQSVFASVVRVEFDPANPQKITTLFDTTGESIELEQKVEMLEQKVNARGTLEQGVQKQGCAHAGPDPICADAILDMDVRFAASLALERAPPMEPSRHVPPSPPLTYRARASRVCGRRTPRIVPFAVAGGTLPAARSRSRAADGAQSPCATISATHVSRVRLGRELTSTSVAALRLLRDFLGVTFRIEADADGSLLLACRGCGFKNLSQRVT